MYIRGLRKPNLLRDRGLSRLAIQGFHKSEIELLNTRTDLTQDRWILKDFPMMSRRHGV